MRVLQVCYCLVIAALLVGCDGPPLEPVPDEAPTPLYKVDRQEYGYFYDLANEPPYEDCAGEDMQTYGTILVFIK